VRRVVVVDDDEVSRRGLGAVLGDHPDIDVVAEIDHDDAAAGGIALWDGIDMAVVDAADERRKDDAFPGVGVVTAIRRHRSRHQTIVVIRTGHFLDDALRLRMREAGADFFYHRSELQNASLLHQLVLHPEAARRGIPAPADTDLLARLGVGSASQVNAGVAFLRRFGPGPANASPRSRQWLAFRRDFNQQARLAAVNADGTGPERDQLHPSMRQVQRFWEWATRPKPPRS
jgi:DNA-binding NarL/FixJ family response regulator